MVANQTQKDLEALAGFVLPLAEQLLKTQQGFHPYGGIMAGDGTMKGFTTDEEEGEERKSQQTVDALTDAFRRMGQEGSAKASVIVCDVRVTPPGTNSETDAVLLILDHVDNYSAEIYMPYQFAPESDLVFGEMFGTPGQRQVFSLP